MCVRGRIVRDLRFKIQKNCLSLFLEFIYSTTEPDDDVSFCELQFISFFPSDIYKCFISTVKV